MKAILFVVLTLVSAGAMAKGKERALLAYLTVQPGAEQQFLDAAQNVIIESRQEEGNLIYNLHQSLENPQQFVFYELFKTEADLKYHRNSKHVKDFLKEVDPILVPGQFIIDEYK